MHGLAHTHSEQNDKKDLGYFVGCSQNGEKLIIVVWKQKFASCGTSPECFTVWTVGDHGTLVKVTTGCEVGENNYFFQRLRLAQSWSSIGNNFLIHFYGCYRVTQGHVCLCVPFFQRRKTCLNLGLSKISAHRAPF